MEGENNGRHGGGGSTTWERCCLAVPSIVISVADNQTNIAKAVDAVGAALYLGPCDNVTALQLANTVKNLIQEPNRLRTLSSQAMLLVDGLGTGRVSTTLRNLL
jgi:spore coat polysaccharide biosynthesis predicted glycosyltransferase SpsG